MDTTLDSANIAKCPHGQEIVDLHVFFVGLIIDGLATLCDGEPLCWRCLAREGPLSAQEGVAIHEVGTRTDWSLIVDVLGNDLELGGEVEVGVVGVLLSIHIFVVFILGLLLSLDRGSALSSQSIRGDLLVGRLFRAVARDCFIFERFDSVFVSCELVLVEHGADLGWGAHRCHCAS